MPEGRGSAVHHLFGGRDLWDQTGKEQFSDGGNGKFVTQGAGDIVQSALFRAGTTVLNRRDPRIMETEVKWGIRDGRRIVPTNFYITGSINSLDFLPGAGFDVKVAGEGAQYRQHRILVGLDLSMTEANTGRVVANVPLQKQIFASEAGWVQRASSATRWCWPTSAGASARHCTSRCARC